MLTILSAMAFTVEDIKSLLQCDFVTELEKVKANVIDKIKQFPSVIQSKLYEDLTVLKIVRRYFFVERDIQHGVVV